MLAGPIYFPSVHSHVHTYSYFGSRLQISKVMLSSQRSAVATPHVPFDIDRLCSVVGSMYAAWTMDHDH